MIMREKKFEVGRKGTFSNPISGKRAVKHRMFTISALAGKMKGKNGGPKKGKLQQNKVR